jgi:hypothetical protein
MLPWICCRAEAPATRPAQQGLNAEKQTLAVPFPLAKHRNIAGFLCRAREPEAQARGHSLKQAFQPTRYRPEIR